MVMVAWSVAFSLCMQADPIDPPECVCRGKFFPSSPDSLESKFSVTGEKMGTKYW